MDESYTRDLMENNVMLQKALLQLVESNNGLTKKIDNLISLFEEAAKNMSSGNTEEVYKLNNKINELIEQNKQLARGLLIMEDKMRKSNISPKPIFRP